MIAFSVIVPAYNAAAVLPCCLAALQQQTLDPDTYEVIVVDDGSRDATADVAAQHQPCAPRVLRAAHGGPARARNLGARAARGEILLFTDADCEPTPDWLARLTTAFGQAQVSGAKGAYRTRQLGLIARFVQQEYQDKYDRLLTQAQIDFVDTYSAAYRRAIFLEYGGFDVSFPAASVEDQEFSFRLAEHGHRLIFVPDAIVYHRHDATLRDYARRKYGIGYWKARLLKRHPGKAVRDSHTPQMLKVQMMLLAAALVTIPMALLNSIGLLIAIGLWAAFFITMLPLLSKIARRDAPVLWIAPLLIIVRAFSLGLGLAIGLLRFNLFAEKP